MSEINAQNLSLTELKQAFSILEVGDEILFSGTVYTARDAAHMRIMELIKQNKELPFELQGAIIYYAGATPAKNGMASGSCGPTTSSRMDAFAPFLYDMGVIATIGKGERSDIVSQSCKKNNSVYFCAIGGAGALAAKSIEESTVVAFDDLGCESIKKMKFKSFPLILATDARGNSLFSEERRVRI